MSAIDNIFNRINDDEDLIFDISRDYNDICVNRLSELSFFGELDKQEFYFVMLHQIKSCNSEDIHNLTLEENEEFYLTNSLSGWRGFTPYSWTVWYLNLEKKYVRIYVTFKYDQDLSPKQNYGQIYESHNSKFVSYVPKNNLFKDFEIEKSDDKEIWYKLIQILEYSRTHEINMNDFEIKIGRNKHTYFGHKKPNMIDDKLKETSPAEIVVVPLQFKHVDIRNNFNVLNILKGASFLGIDFKNNGIIQNYPHSKELLEYLYSIVQFTNDYKDELNLACGIGQLEKHFFNYSWDISNNEEEMDENRKSKTLYELRICKFLDQIIVEAEVAEFGIRYIISNLWGIQKSKKIVF